MVALDINNSYHKEVFKEGKKRYKNLVVPPPTQMDIELTRSCSLNCVYCGRNDKHINKLNSWKMDEQLIYSLEFEISFLKSIFFCGGGETFHHKEVNNILKYIKGINKECRISMPTNFQVKLSEKDILLYADLEITLMVSIDSIDYDMNEITRPGSDSIRIINSIKEIIDIKKKHNLKYPRICILSVVTKHILGNIEKNLQYHLDIGCDEFRLQSYIDYWGYEGYAHNIQESDKKQIDDEIYKIYEIVKPRKNFSISGSYIFYHSELANKDPNIQQLRNGPCLDPWFFSYMFSNSCFVPCANGRNIYEFGTVDYGVDNIDQIIEQSKDFYYYITDDDYKLLKEWLIHSHKPYMKLWNNIEMMQLRKQIQDGSMNEKCLDCKNRKLHNTWYICS